MSQLLRARRLLTGQGWLDDHQLRMDRGVITAIEPIPAGVNTREADLLCPAYIDIHVHGGAGVDVMDDAPDVLDRLAMHKAREGDPSPQAKRDTRHAGPQRRYIRANPGRI